MSFASFSHASHSSSSSSSLSRSSWNPARDNGKSCKTSDADVKFSEMIKSSPYNIIKGVQSAYKVYINRNQLHWYLLLKCSMKDATFPFITFEVNTPDMSSLSRLMVLYDDDKYNEKTTYCGSIDEKLLDITEVADRMVAQMESYSLFSSNCQHFCNNFLNYYSLDVYRTTIGKEVTARIKREPVEPDRAAEIRQMLDVLSALADNPLSSSVQREEERLRRMFGTVFNAYVGARIH